MVLDRRPRTQLAFRALTRSHAHDPLRTNTLTGAARHGCPAVITPKSTCTSPATAQRLRAPSASLSLSNAAVLHLRG